VVLASLADITLPELLGKLGKADREP
jgi:hypothetical protein